MTLYIIYNIINNVNKIPLHTYNMSTTYGYIIYVYTNVMSFEQIMATHIISYVCEQQKIAIHVTTYVMYTNKESLHSHR